MEVGEAPSRKYAREKLEAINKFLPVHERIKKKLQDRQMMKADLIEGRQELFELITTSIKTTLYGDKDDAFKPDKDEKPIASLLKEISENVKPAELIIKKEKKRYNWSWEEATIRKQRERFNEKGLTKIEETSIENFPFLAVETFNERKKYLEDKNYLKTVNNIDSWADALFRVKTKKPKVRETDPEYLLFSKVLNVLIKKYEKILKISKTQKQKRKGKMPLEPTPGFSGEDKELLTEEDKELLTEEDKKICRRTKPYC